MPAPRRLSRLTREKVTHCGGQELRGMSVSDLARLDAPRDEPERRDCAVAVSAVTCALEQVPNLLVLHRVATVSADNDVPVLSQRPCPTRTASRRCQHRVDEFHRRWLEDEVARSPQRIDRGQGSSTDRKAVAGWIASRRAELAAAPPAAEPAARGSAGSARSGNEASRPAGQAPPASTNPGEEVSHGNVPAPQSQAVAVEGGTAAQAQTQARAEGAAAAAGVQRAEPEEPGRLTA